MTVIVLLRVSKHRSFKELKDVIQRDIPKQHSQRTCMKIPGGGKRKRERWEAYKCFINCEGQNHKTVSIDHNFWRERTAKGESNWGPFFLSFCCSEHCFSAPSSKLCQNWLRHWRGTLFLRTAVYRLCQHLPKSVGTNKTVEAHS